MKPFDLEAAKRGEPVCTRDGTPVQQLVHFPEGVRGNKIAALSGGVINAYDDQGRYYGDEGPVSTRDLFMAHRKRTVWVNLYEEGKFANYRENEESANERADGINRIGNRAWPLEIED